MIENSKYATCTLGLLLCFAVLTIAQKSERDPNTIDPDLKTHELRDIERLEDEWNLINEISDADGKQRLLADDSYHVGPSGRRYSKEQDIAAMKSSRGAKDESNRELKFSMSDRRIRLYGDAAVVTATGQSVSTINGVTKRGNIFRVVHVWEKREGKWFLVVDQVTTVTQ